MPTAKQRIERAQRARANGARSHGPKPAAGLHRARTAGIRTGLYTTSVSGICPESNAEFLPFHARLLAHWQPRTSQAELLVKQLITVLWDIRILQSGYNMFLSRLFESVAATSPYAGDPAKLTIEACKLALAATGGTVARVQARLGACFRTRARLEHEILRLERSAPTSAPSQKLLKMNTQPYADVIEKTPLPMARPRHQHLVHRK